MTVTMRRRNPWRPGLRAGFSMAEAMLVVVILGVVASFAMPAMQRGVARSKADRAANVIANEMRNAFSLAARQRKPVNITLNTSARTLSLVDRAAGTVFVRQNLSNPQAEYGLTALAGSSTTVTVFPNGVASDTMRITLNVGPNQRVVRMTRVGQVRIQ